MRQLDLVPAQSEPVLTHVGDAHPRDDRQRQSAVHETLAELRSLSILGVEMNLVGVVGQQSKPDVVGLRNGSAQTAAINVADLEVLEIAPLPAGLHCHRGSPLRTTVIFISRLWLYTLRCKPNSNYRRAGWIST